MRFQCWHGGHSPPHGVSEVCQPQGSSFIFPVEASGLLIAMLRGRILCCCFCGWDSCGELSLAALLHATTEAAEKSRRPRVSIFVFREGRASVVPGAISVFLKG